jgi:hypothetical protein
MKKKPRIAPFIYISVPIPMPPKYMPTVIPIRIMMKTIYGKFRIYPCFDYFTLHALKNLFLRYMCVFTCKLKETLHRQSKDELDILLIQLLAAIVLD